MQFLKRNLDEELSEKERMKTLGVILESMFSSLVEARSVAEVKLRNVKGASNSENFGLSFAFFSFAFYLHDPRRFDPEPMPVFFAIKCT